MAVRKKFTYSVSPARKSPATAKSGPQGTGAAGDAGEFFRQANVLYGKAQYVDALALYDRALELAPQHVAALANRGTTLARLNRFAEAVASYDRAAVIDPANIDVHYKRASTLRALNRFDEAIAAYSRILELAPGHAVARNRRGTCLLLTGRFTEGWRDYEARWQEWRDKRAAETGPRKKLLDPDNFGKPLWNGQADGKSTLLVWSEQGLGDQILFSTMLDEAAARVGKVILALEDRLHPLFARSFPDFEITTFAKAVKSGGYDMQIPLGGLGRLLRNGTDDFLRNRKTCLKADPARVARLRDAVGAGNQRVCGLSWLSRNEDTGAMKSLSLATLAPLLLTPGLRFVDLQYGDTAAERAAFKQETGVDIAHLDAIDNLEDIDGLAALITACDVVVTISNTTAHLAGALGKTVLLMLPHSQGRLWYWQANGHDTLWYPQVRLFRQPVTGDWGPVIAAVQAAIAAPAIDRANKPRESLALMPQASGGKTKPPAAESGSAKKIVTFSMSPPRSGPDASVKSGNAAALRKAAAHLQAGELDQARQLALAVLETQAQHFDALHLLGVIAGLKQNPAESVELISKALALKPSATAYANRGAARLILKHHAKALADADKAIELQPNLAVAHCVRGHALTGLKRIREAFSSYDAAVALNPDYDEAWHHRGNTCMGLGMLQNAIASYDRALAINPANFGGLGNQSMCHLLAGDFERGWDRYEARWKALEAGFVAPPGSGMFMLTPDNFGKPLWDGTPTRGTVLVWPEQGIGDQIIFASMLADLQQRVGKVVLALDERLHPLFARSFPDCVIITREAARRPNNYDFQIPAGGLGRHFRRSIDACLRNRRAFLKADKIRSARLRAAINPGDQRLCGLSWSSVHPEFGNDKSIALTALQPLLNTPGVRFVDLQYGDTRAERALLKQNTGIDILHLDDLDLTGDIDGLAALIDACDVIVTISNTTAHIAGALGKPVWLMLPQNMGRFWYWQAEREDTLWYPQVHVVRQTHSGEWADVIARVGTALAALPAPGIAAAAPATAEEPRPARKKKPRTTR